MMTLYNLCQKKFYKNQAEYVDINLWVRFSRRASAANPPLLYRNNDPKIRCQRQLCEIRHTGISLDRRFKRTKVLYRLIECNLPFLSSGRMVYL